MKTAKDIILETAAFYNSKNRSMADEGCCYLDEKGNNCALGRCIKPERIKEIVEYDNSAAAISLLKHEDYGFDILKDEYRIEDVQFWEDLQRFHDSEPNWDAFGISKRGREVAEKLIAKYSNE